MHLLKSREYLLRLVVWVVSTFLVAFLGSYLASDLSWPYITAASSAEKAALAGLVAVLSAITHPLLTLSSVPPDPPTPAKPSPMPPMPPGPPPVAASVDRPVAP